MSQTGKQACDNAPTSPGELAQHLAGWERRQRAKFRMRAVLAVFFFVGMIVMLFLLSSNPSKGQEAIGAAVIFGLAGIFQSILALSARAEGRALQSCKKAVEAKEAQRQQP